MVKGVSIELTSKVSEMLDNSRNTFRAVARRIDAGKYSERRTILIVLMFLILSVWYFFFFTPVDKEKKQIMVKIDAQVKQLQLSQSKYQGLLSGEEGIKQLQQQKKFQVELTELNERIQKITGDVVPANQMAELLKTVLKNEGNLKFISLKNLPARNLASPTGEISEQDYMLLQQGIELVFDGSYADTLKYLQALEQTKKWHVLWDSLDYEVAKYPDARVTLHVYTLIQYDNQDAKAQKNEETRMAVVLADQQGAKS